MMARLAMHVAERIISRRADGLPMQASSMSSDPSQHVRRVTLPSGRAIEVVYFQAGGSVAPAADLHVCPVCDGHLVHPVQWAEVDPHRWEVQLRCPECEHWRTDVFDQAAVDAFDDHLDAGTDALARDLRRLERANMEEEANRLAAALAADALLPEDF
jgi:non-ribosomal peptide synthetase component F